MDRSSHRCSRQRLSRFIVLVALLLPTLLAFAHEVAGAPSFPPIVPADRGLVKGVNSEYGRAFRGIPYAVPPVGKLRW